MRPHQGEHFPVDTDHAKVIGIDDPAEFLRIRLLTGAEHQHTGTLDERIRSSDGCSRFAEGPDGIFAGDVQRKTGDTINSDAVFAEAPRAGDDLPAVIAEGHGSMETEAAGSAGDPDCFLLTHAVSALSLLFT